jgi:hypothetical protein
VGPTLSPAVAGGRSFLRDSLAPHLAGQLIGGLAMGLLAVAVGASLALVAPDAALTTTAAVLAACYAVAELAPFRVWRPQVKWQVPSGYRRTKYHRSMAFLWGTGLGFGWATLQPTTAMLTLFIGMSAAGPTPALVAGLAFGATRGMTIVLGLGARTRDEVSARFSRVASHKRWAAAGSLLSGLAVAAVLAAQA